LASHALAELSRIQNLEVGAAAVQDVPGRQPRQVAADHDHGMGDLAAHSATIGNSRTVCSLIVRVSMFPSDN
jgi:hypothetical protein